MLLQFLSGARRVLVPGLLCILAAGCTTTAKLNSFAELSKVGIAYSDAAGAVIYVGKAKRLKRRLAVYRGISLASRRKRHRKIKRILTAAASCRCT